MSPTSDSTPLIDGLLTKVTDNDPEETREWHESLDALIQEKGGPRARYILLSMLAEARKKNVVLPRADRHSLRQHDLGGERALLPWR